MVAPSMEGGQRESQLPEVKQNLVKQFNFANEIAKEIKLQGISKKSRVKDIAAILTVQDELQTIKNELQKKDLSSKALSECNDKINQIYERIITPLYERIFNKPILTPLESPKKLNYYFGNMTRNDAQTLLNSQPPDSFLLRDSSNQGAFVISYKTKNPNNPVGHCLVHVTPKGYEIEVEGKKKYFNSIPALIEKSTIFLHPYVKAASKEEVAKEAQQKSVAKKEEVPKHVQQESVAKLDYYHGNISADHAMLILKDLQVGSYLVRDSSQQGVYTISYKALDQKIYHIRVPLTPKGYEFQIDNTYFPTFQELINRLSQFTKYPVAKVRENVGVAKEKAAVASAKESAAAQVSRSVTLNNQNIPRDFWQHASEYAPFSEIRFDGGVYGFDHAYLLNNGAVEVSSSENNILWNPDLRTQEVWKLPTEKLVFNQATFLINGIEGVIAHFPNLKTLELTGCSFPQTSEDQIKRTLTDFKALNPNVKIVLENILLKKLKVSEPLTKWCLDNGIKIS